MEKDSIRKTSDIALSAIKRVELVDSEMSEDMAFMLGVSVGIKALMKELYDFINGKGKVEFSDAVWRYVSMSGNREVQFQDCAHYNDDGFKLDRFQSKVKE